ncbi:MAG: excinuclease ABC subunit C [Marinoscillum sp.]|jgi:excinuclease ABC subunit C
MDSHIFQSDQYKTLPHEPGVYKFLNKDHKIIYVGKAKDLNKRVSNYFQEGTHSSYKTTKLVKEITGIEVVLVNSEIDALLLENTLIKENQPRFNILLKDDKTFPSICVTKERFPRVFSTRTIDTNTGAFYGPYTSVKAMNGVLDLIRKLNKIRTCSLNLTQRNIQNRKFKVCLEYHLGNCLGPCEGLQNEEDYLLDIHNTELILKGHIGQVKAVFKDLMNTASEGMNFEEAYDYKIKIEYLERFQNKSVIVNPKMDDLDVIGILQSEDNYYANYMRVSNGTIILSETVEVKRKFEDVESELFQIILFNLRNKFLSDSNEVLSNNSIDSWGKVEINIPKIGDKKKLLDLSMKNAMFFKAERLKSNTEKEPLSNATLRILQNDLNLKSIPNHIECFDNSNIQGTNPVSSMVCFKKGKPSKRDYRKYHVKTVVGPDDFASMKEVVGRRYKHLKEDDSSLPDLIVIDGGKGQLSAACSALVELDLYGSIPIIGIAKRLEEIYLPEDPIPVHISKKSPSLKLLQHLRDEAHRFAITFHRNTRSKQSIKSSIDEVAGIGPTTIQKLLQHFKSLNRIQKASKEELTKIVGRAKAQIIIDFIKKKEAHI